MRGHVGYVVPAVLENAEKGFFVYVYPRGWYVHRPQDAGPCVLSMLGPLATASQALQANNGD